MRTNSYYFPRKTANRYNLQQRLQTESLSPDSWIKKSKQGLEDGLSKIIPSIKRSIILTLSYGSVLGIAQHVNFMDTKENCLTGIKIIDTYKILFINVFIDNHHPNTIVKIRTSVHADPEDFKG